MGGERDPSLRHPRLLRPLVGVVAHDEAEKETGHDDIAQPEHGEVAGGAGGREDQLARQGEPWRVASHCPAHPAHPELPGHDPHRVVGRPGGHPHHHIGTEHVLQNKQIKIK